MRPLAYGARWVALATVGLLGCVDAPEGAREDLDASPTVSPATRDQLLLQTALVALPPDEFGATDLPDPASTNAGLVVRYCGQCHAVPMPTMHSAADWPGVVRRMWLRMDRLPDTLGLEIPAPGDRVQMLDYLTGNALRVSGAMLPPGRGREEFAVVCSRCHTLPDPWTHSAEDWPTVFMRMERNMERMNVAAAAPEEATRILSYLQGLGPRP